MFEGIFEAIHREMDALEEKYSSGVNPMNSQDLEHIDTMAHALKCIATYEAMVGGRESESSYKKVRRYRY